MKMEISNSNWPRRYKTRPIIFILGPIDQKDVGVVDKAHVVPSFGPADEIHHLDLYGFVHMGFLNLMYRSC